MKAIVHWDHKPGASHETLRAAFQAFDYAARSFDAELLFVDLTNTLSVLAPPNEVFSNLEDALKAAGGDPVYFLAEGEVELDEWNPPENPVVVVGPDYGSLPVPENAETIKLTVANAQPELWSHNVLCAALYVESRRG